MKALITGGAGQLAQDIIAQLANRGDGSVALRHDQLDILDDEQTRRIVADVQPDVIFNCAAFHNVDVCEREADTAFAVNARAVKHLAEAARMNNSKLVHVSTNYVFDGVQVEPYAEQDLPHPLSVYGVSKLAGEHLALAVDPTTLIVRTGALYGAAGNASKGGNFVQRMLARAQQQDELQVVSDQLINPTFTPDLAEAILESVDRDVHGIVHLVGSGDCSWFEFTQAIMDLAQVSTPVRPSMTVQQLGGAGRPLNGTLERPATDAAGLTPLRPWQQALADYMNSAGLAN